ncbi:MAG: ABC transporter permease [Dissulfurispiraceae bacterium]|jgi:putative ABC transport system permease protein|nr:ABC transporter permease [Dissulfurispiraceae bacterium]
MNRILINLKIALGSLANYKLRTALAVLGVFLGTFSLIVVSNLSSSLAKKTAAEIETLGKDLLIVRSGIVRRFGPGTSLLSEAANLTIADAEAIKQSSVHVLKVSPSSNKSFPVRYGSTTLRSVLVIGATPNYSEVRNFFASEGSFITAEDNLNLNNSAVIGAAVAKKLFQDQNALGKFLMIHRAPFQIAGIMEEKGVDLSGADQDNTIFVPLNTYLAKLVNQDFISSINVQAVNSRSIQAAKADIESLLRKRHKIKPPAKDDFAVIDLKDVTQLKSQAMSMITILGRIAASVSFLIGGLGILSIMILIVSERKVEIGIRRAIGSRKRDIILQFLTESSFISIAGGVIGLVLGLPVSLLVLKLSDLPFAVSIPGLVVAVIASIGIGIIAGIYPSKKATLIQPVDIMRM